MNIADDSDLDAAMESLPWQQREHIHEAVANGRAVDDPALAETAALWADRSYRRTSQAFTVVLAACVAAGACVIAVVAVSSDDFDTIGISIAFAIAISSVGLIMWAQLRPSRRSELANLAVIERGEGPSTREWTNWVWAWLVAWPVAGVVGLALQLLGIDALAGPIGLIAFFAAVWATKRTIDRFESSS